MKKLLLVSAVAALSVTSVYAETGVYGKVGADLRYAKDGDVTLDNKHTRLGVSGSSPISANTNAIYQVELGLTLDPLSNTDDNDDPKFEGDNFTMRDTYVGLQNSEVGAVKVGRLTTVDDNVNFTNPSAYWNAGYLGNGGGDRVNNAIAYESPNFSGFQALAVYQVDSADKGGKNGTAGTYGVAGKYDAGNFKVGASYIDKKSSSEAFRVSGAVTAIPQVELSGAYQVTDYNKAQNNEKENTFIVAAKYDVPNSPWAGYIEYDGVENMKGAKDADKSVVSLGGDYAFNKALSGRIYAGFEDEKGKDDTYGFGTGLTYSFKPLSYHKLL